ncbi:MULTISPECIES: hypothetical protein [unclassified Duganella]|jgi:hypothetical protein|uniref:hypothetical protein n=1 Tax=unclassified Duganella TaxID=2636909 RepID=UPI0008840078|nr:MULTISPECIES: hypothetical protein [unclassified Duganella]SDH30870.1 hypothetical protein SAMN05216320_1121 [Duganella sp. OV458]SDK47778.1 hypothetical protein SAMN05428973_1121 [Duganella sp. OV510]
MSHKRLARISLLLAAIGLNAAPAVMGLAPVHAAEEKKAPEQPANTVRPDMYKLIDPAQTKPLIDAKNYAEFQNRIDQAAALPNVTPYEAFILNRMRLQLAQAQDNNEASVKALEAIISSDQLKPEERARFIEATANIYYSGLKNFDKAIEWFDRYGKETGDTAKFRPFALRAYFLKNDFATAKAEAIKDIDAAKAANTAPAKDTILVLANVGVKNKEPDTYLRAVEELTRYYPTEDYWNDLLSRTRGKKTYNNRLDLDLVRLKAVTVPGRMETDDYVEQAELATLGGFFTEAKIALEKAYPNGVVPAGQYKAQIEKMRTSANKGAADDAKNIDAGIPAAQKSKDGVGLVNLGYNYVTLGQYDKGIDLMKQGIAKGVSKNPEDAKLRLGYAQAIAGKKDESIATLTPLAAGADPRADLARYWINYQTAPKIAAGEKQ